MRLGWVGRGVTDEKGGGVQEKRGSGPPDPPPPLDTPMSGPTSKCLFKFFFSLDYSNIGVL